LVEPTAHWQDAVRATIMYVAAGYVLPPVIAAVLYTVGRTLEVVEALPVAVPGALSALRHRQGEPIYTPLDYRTAERFRDADRRRRRRRGRIEQDLAECRTSHPACLPIELIAHERNWIPWAVLNAEAILRTQMPPIEFATSLHDETMPPPTLLWPLSTIRRVEGAIAEVNSELDGALSRQPLLENVAFDRRVIALISQRLQANAIASRV